MKKITITAALGLLCLSEPSWAGDIERACRSTGRDQATTSRCACIQDVADLRLNRTDQRRAARFFKDPHEAQVIRQSSNRQDEAFWGRYKEWGELAAQACSRS